MREETRKRLERTLMLRRLKWVGAALALVPVIAAGMWWTGRDAQLVEQKRVPGVVEHVAPLNGTNTRSVEDGLSVDIKLGNGRVVPVMVLKANEPHVGDHVEITERIFGSGRHLYTWK
jgi:hypothetical protein